MEKENFSLKEIVIETRNKVDGMDDKLNALLGLRDEVKENTNFRNKAMNAVVGTAFMALAALGYAVLKVTGILKI